MQAIHFKKDEISLVFLGNPCLKIYRFGCIPFISDTRHVFYYEIVDQDEEDSNCVYLEIKSHKKSGILHEKKPVCDPDTDSYKSNGLTLYVETVIHDGTKLEIPENRLLVLRAKKGKKSGKLPDFLY